MEFLDKLRKLDLTKRKLIVGLVIAILGIMSLIIWGKVTAWRLNHLNTKNMIKDMSLPEINIPTITIPTLPTNIPTGLGL